MEDELAPELDDNPGTTIGTKCSVLHKILFPIFGQMWFLTAGPLIGKKCSSQTLANDRTASVPSSICRVTKSSRWLNIYRCFLVRLHFSTGCYYRCGFPEFSRVSSSPELKSFLLSMCIDAPESTTNSRSSGFFEEGAGITHASAGK